MPPVNDNFASATILSGASGSVNGTLVGSTLEVGGYTLDGFGDELAYWGAATVNDGRSVWYKFNAAGQQRVISFTIAGTGFNPYVEQYRFDTGINYEYLGYLGNNTSSPPAKTLVLPAGEDIWLVVDNWQFDTSEGPFTLSWQELPLGDTAATAIVITPGVPVVGSTAGMTDISGGNERPPYQTVWYKFQAPSSADLKYFLSDYDFTAGDGVIRVYYDTVEVPSSYVTNEQGAYFLFNGSSGAANEATTINYASVAGRWYYVRIGAATSGHDNSFTLNVEEPPPEDNHNSYVYIPEAPRWWIGGTNVGATMEAGEQVHAGVGAYRSSWYYLQAVHVGTYTFEIERVWGDLTQPVLAAYTGYGGAFGSMTLLDSDATTPLPSITFTVTEGMRGSGIGIVVASRSLDSQGGYILKWSVDPAYANSTIADAQVISGTGSVTNRLFDGAMMELGDPELMGWDGGDGAHWYKFVAPANGSLKATMTTVDASPGNGMRLKVFKGTNWDNFECLGEQTFGSETAGTSRFVNVPIESGETYFIYTKGHILYKRYSLSWIINTDVRANFSSSSVSDFDTNVGGSDSGGEMVFGPGDYVTKTFNSGSTHLRAKDQHYIGFSLRYGNANRIVPTAGAYSIPVLQLLDETGAVVQTVLINEDLAYYGLNDCLSLNGETLVPQRISENKKFVEIFLYPEQAYGTGNIDSMYIEMWVNGQRTMTPNATNVQLVGKNGIAGIKLGYINEPGTSNVELKISDVRIKNTIMDEGAPDPPGYSRPQERIFRSSGYTANWNLSVHSTRGDYPYAYYYHQAGPWDHYNSYVISDPTGGGKGKVIDRTTNLGAVSQVLGSYSYFPALNRLSFGSWFYFSTMAGKVTTRIIRYAFQYTASGYTYRYLDCEVDPDGAVSLAFKNSTSDRLYAHRVVPINTWVWIEVEVTQMWPRVAARWWINNEEQTPFEEPLVSGRGWNGGVSLDSYWYGFNDTNGIRGYQGAYALGIKGPLGPVKAIELNPNSSGTHSPGVPQVLTNGSLPHAFWTSTDDGANTTELGVSDSIHGLLDDNPPTTSGSSDIVGAASVGPNYAEFGHEDVGGSQDVYLVNAFAVTRTTHAIKSVGLLGYRDVDWIPTSTERNPFGALSSEMWHRVGNDEVVQILGTDAEGYMGPRYNQVIMPRSPDGADWTATILNGMTERWGYQTNFDGAQPNALLSSLLEAMVPDSYGSGLGTYTPAAPFIYTYTPQGDGAPPVNNGWDEVTLNSCDGPLRASLKSDPNMVNKVYWNVEINPDNYGDEIWWRIFPAYDNSIPGLNGVFTNQKVSVWTYSTGYNTYYAINRDAQVALHWVDQFFNRIESDTLVYDPCALGSKVDINGNVQIQAYVVDTYGVASPTTSRTLNITEGLCCAGIVMFNTLAALR